MNDTPVTVLAVDDQPANLRLLDAVLGPRGYRVVTASSGQEALALLEELDIDLVLLDVVMPNSTGTRSAAGSAPRSGRRTFLSSWSRRAAASSALPRWRPEPTTS